MKISWTRAYLLFEDALRLIVRATGHLQVALAVFIGLALKSWCPWPSIFFLYVIWLFPERVLGVIALSFYLLLWLPSSYHLPFHIHMVLLAAYMLATPPRWRRFRTWSGWNSIRNRFYPIKYDTFAPPRSTHPDRREAPRIYAIAPHGVYGEGVHLTMVLTEKFADVVPVGSSVMTWLPIVKGKKSRLSVRVFHLLSNHARGKNRCVRIVRHDSRDQVCHYGDTLCRERHFAGARRDSRHTVRKGSASRGSAKGVCRMRGASRGGYHSRLYAQCMDSL